MSQIYVPGNGRMGFSGAAVFALDGASPGASVAFANQRVVFNKNSNNSYPDLIDAVAFQVSKVPGVRMGQIQITGVVQPDRGFHTFLNSAFGPRTAGQLSPWLMNLIPYSGGTVIKAAGIWWSTIRLYSAFALGGGQQMLFFVLSGLCFDPDNTLGAPTLSVPGYVGAQGAGIAPFSRHTFNNDSSTVYDLIRAYDMMLTNRLQVIPAIKDPVNRLAAGAQPGTIGGALTLGQLKGATTPIPLTDGSYPIDVLAPTGDGTHTLTLAGSWSYDSEAQSYQPTDFIGEGGSYTLFGTSAGATATAVNPFVASYA
jgi:hypothetical protein